MSSEPAEVFPAGELLTQELEARGWTQAEFAEIIDRPAQVVSEIASGKKEITRESAAQIGAAFGTAPEFWLKAQDQYFLWKQNQDAAVRKRLDNVRLRARLTNKAPLAVLRKRGFITATTAEGQERQLCELLGVSDLDQEPRLLAVARRSNTVEQASPTQVAWISCVRKKADKREVSNYDPKGLRQVAMTLSRMLRDPASFESLPTKFAEVGVRLVYVEAFPSSKIDGVSFQPDENPVIGLSGRGHRMDKVLFTLLHEVAHVLHNHIAKGPVLNEPGAFHYPDLENEADRQAREWIIPGELHAPTDRISKNWLDTTATNLGVHPVLIVGRLQKDGLLNWRSLLAKDAPTVETRMQSW